MPHTITLFEHGTPTETIELSPEQREHLAALQRRMPEPIVWEVRQGNHWTLKAGSYVGVVRLGALTIQILPKIYRSSTATDPAREATRNLLHMLHYAGNIRIHESDISRLMERESDWFETLTYLFASHLLEEWQHGPVRQYRAVDDDLPLLKGKWRLHEQLRRPERAHRFAVAYDEYTVDVPLNHIFRFVVERLSRLTRSGSNARLLSNMRILMDDVTLLPVMTLADIERISFDRLTQRYEPLLNMARLFIEQGALQTAGGDSELFAFVFDMNMLFERFIAGFLLLHRAIALPPMLQACEMLPQARGDQRYLAASVDDEGRKCFRLRPDLLFRYGKQTALIADTKYKTLDARGAGISEADFYQMVAYGHRYACPRMVLLYPQTADMPDAVRRSFRLEDGSGYHVCAATVDVRHDLGLHRSRERIAAELNDILARR